VAEHLDAASYLVTGGLGCWTAATEAGLEHTSIGSGNRAAGWSPFMRVNTTLGNEGGDHRHLPLRQLRACRPQSRRLCLALQPPLPAYQPDPAPGAGRERGQGEALFERAGDLVEHFPSGRVGRVLI
jgi:hypothetical protein